MINLLAMAAERRIDISTLTTAALATVVKVEGSAYRRPGARMLIFSDGFRLGTISGGCLEADVAARAVKIMTTNTPGVIRYDSRSGFDPVTEMGCSGAIEILVEPINSSVIHSLEFIASFEQERGSGFIATVFRTESGCTVSDGYRLMHRWQNNFAGDVLDDLILSDMQSSLEKVRTENIPVVQTVSLPGWKGQAEILIEPVQSPISLILCGAGYDAVPLSQIAAILGWNVTIIDHRDFLLDAHKFPESIRLVPDRLKEEIRFDDRTAVITMTHSYERDREWLKNLLTTDVGYIGVLGPKKRTEQMQGDLLEEGFALNDLDRMKLHTPTGLDLGAETAEEVALSIVSEIQAVFNRRNGGFLRDRKVSIHTHSPIVKVSIGQEDSCLVLV